MTDQLAMFDQHAGRAPAVLPPRFTTRRRRFLPPMLWRQPVFGPLVEAHGRVEAVHRATVAARWVKTQEGRR